MDNFPGLGEEIDIQFQEVQRVPNRINLKRTKPRHAVIKTAEVKNKERILKLQGQTTTYVQGNFHKAICRLINRNSAGQREWQDTPLF